MFFIAAALVLTTAGVFAGKARFVTFPVYAYNTNTSQFVATAVSTSITGGDWLQGSGSGVQAYVTDHSGAQFPIYYAKDVTKPIFINTTF